MTTVEKLMTPAQCRAARAALGRKAEALTHEAGLAIWTLRRFESGRPVGPKSVRKLQAALQRGGVAFQLDGRDGVFWFRELSSPPPLAPPPPDGV